MPSRTTNDTRQRAAVLMRPMRTQILEVSVPVPDENQVRVRLQGCGICPANLPVWEGRPWFNYPLEPGAPGHEGWGIVDAVGSAVRDLEVGQRVALMSSRAYAEYDVTTRNCVVPLPEELDDEPFPGEPFGSAINIFEHSDIREGNSVAIVGAGFLGLLLTQLAADAGAHPVVLSHRSFALELAMSMDAEETLVTTDDGRDAQRALRITNGIGFDRVIELAGTRSALDLASAICAEQARLVIRDHPPSDMRHANTVLWTCRGLDVVHAPGRSRDRFVSDVEKAIQAALEGRLDPFPLLTHTVVLNCLDRGFMLMRERPDGFVKALLLHEQAA